MKQKILLIVLMFSLASCSDYRGITEEQARLYIEQAGMLLPDSLKTEEQLFIKEKLTEISFEKVEVRNNCMRLTVDRDYFVSVGLPAYCYDLIMFQFEKNNRFAKEFNKTAGSYNKVDLAAAFYEAQEEYRKLGVRKYLEHQDSVKLAVDAFHLM